ncbi:MAG: hypothetical protein HYV24_03440 [Deltaproteobacteria bacterium]|nr:hypothetical protein [Deltaproteobacteria bacterium]
MAKKSVFIIFLLMIFLAASAMADDHPEHKGANIESDTRAKNDVLTKMESSKSYLNSAEKIVAQGENKEAASLLKNAQLMMKEGIFHYETAQYTYSVEDFIEVVQLATHAMILVSNEQNWETRELVMYEESFQTQKREAEKKETTIKKNMEEAVVFINTAERILRRFPDESAFRQLAEAQDSLMISHAALEDNNYYGCLEELDKSYKLATNAIRDAYKAHGISFVFNPQQPVRN